MTERRRPHRRGRGPRPYGRTPADNAGEPNPYLDGAPEAPPEGGDVTDTPPRSSAPVATEDAPAAPPPASSAGEPTIEPRDPEQRPPREFREQGQRPREHREPREPRGHHRDNRGDRGERGDRGDRGDRGENGGRPQGQQFNGNGRR